MLDVYILYIDRYKKKNTAYITSHARMCLLAVLPQLHTLVIITARMYVLAV